MIHYNTSFHADRAIEPEFVAWLRESASRSGEEAGMSEPRLYRLLDTPDEGVVSYVLRFTAPDAATVGIYRDGAQSRLLTTMMQRWGGRAVAFSTSMEPMEL